MMKLPLSAIVLMVIGMSLIPAGDTAGKLLTTQHGVASFFVAWSRFSLGLLLLAILLWRPVPWSLLRNWRIWVRGALITCAISSILTALKTVPLADAFGAFFVGPTVSFILSVWLLREPLDWTRAGWLALGFVGVLLITRPGFGGEPGIFFAVLAGSLYGAFLTASRWLADTAGPRELLLSQLAIGTVLLLPIGATQTPEFTWEISWLVTASALASGLGNLLLVMAYQRAAATALAPLVYTQLVAAAALGWAIFGDLPDVFGWLGLGVLVISGLGAAIYGRTSGAK